MEVAGPLGTPLGLAVLKSGLHARGEGERVLALESREGTRASRRASRVTGEVLGSLASGPTTSLGLAGPTPMHFKTECETSLDML